MDEWPKARWSIIPRFALLIAGFLLAAGAAIIFYNDRLYREQQATHARAQADILAASVTAAVDFNDAATAREYVGALGAGAEIEAAGVYDAAGHRMAGFARANEMLPATAPTIGMLIGDETIALVHPIVHNGSTIGRIYLRTLIEPASRRLARYSVIALLAIMAALVVAVLGSAHAALRKVNRQLEERARQLAETNDALQTQIAEREKAEEALRQSQKMEAVGQLTGGVAHDFNNLLTIITGNLDIAARVVGDSDNPRLKRLLDNATKGAERAASLTQRLLAFSRRQALDPKPTDANKLIAGMTDLLTRALPETIRLETVSGAGLWRTEVDPHQLENAILNLAVNARDAMPEGGRLTIEASNAWLDDSYAAQHVEVSPGQYVVIAVTDTGMGMPRDVLDKVFEPFFTTKEVGKGTGLGLSMVYGFVKQSGGHVKIYSEVGQGTTIKIYLPRLAADEVETAAEPSLELVPGHPEETILVVEDDNDVRAYTVETLTTLGYHVLEAANGPEALRLIEREGQSIHLLFTDVVMPEMSGRQLAEAAQRIMPRLKVLYTSGYTRNAIVHGGRLDQGVEMISKPFTVAALATKIRDMLDRREAVEPPMQQRGDAALRQDG